MILKKNISIVYLAVYTEVLFTLSALFEIPEMFCSVKYVRNLL